MIKIKEIILKLSIAMCLICALTISTNYSFISTAIAQDVPETACDPQYYEAITNKAWAEAQREIAQNQNLIVKPDSVFEYSCFGDFVSRLAMHDDLFSEMGCCGFEDGDEESLDLILSSVVMVSVNDYLTANYADDAYGGRGGIEKGESDAVAEETHPCIAMSEIWNLARCDVLAATNGEDGFHDLSYFAGKDPRQKPEACESADVLTTGFKEALQTAYNGKEPLYTLAPSTDMAKSAGARYEEDPIELEEQLKLILPVGTELPGGGAVECAEAIETGIQVIRDSGDVLEYPDAVCPNPGCHYDPPFGCSE